MNETQHQSSEFDEEHVRQIAQAQRRLYAFVLSLVRRPADADDILQETNLVLWRKRDTFKSETDFFAWAFEIARLQALGYWSRQAKNGFPFDADMLADIAEVASMESEKYDLRETALHRCLQKLPVVQRKLITRRYQPDVAVNSLADEIGKSAKAVSESLRRIRETLRKCIERTLVTESGQ